MHSAVIVGKKVSEKHNALGSLPEDDRALFQELAVSLKTPNSVVDATAIDDTLDLSAIVVNNGTPDIIVGAVKSGILGGQNSTSPAKKFVSLANDPSIRKKDDTENLHQKENKPATTGRAIARSPITGTGSVFYDVLPWVLLFLDIKAQSALRACSKTMADFLLAPEIRKNFLGHYLMYMEFNLAMFNRFLC